MSRFLEILGVHAMTNREALMEELDALEDADFEHLVLDCDSPLPEALNRIKCHDCMRLHDGKCPAPGDDDECIVSMESWLAQTCHCESLLWGVT